MILENISLVWASIMFIIYVSQFQFKNMEASKLNSLGGEQSGTS